MNDLPNEQDNDAPADPIAEASEPQTEEPTEAPPAPEPKTEPERPLFVRVGIAYHTLMNKVSENQKLVHAQRVEIASLRARIRELVATEHALDDDNSEEEELRNTKLAVQTDDCNNLIRHAEQIREHIHYNSGEAETLLAPLRTSMDLLSVRVQYIRTLEHLVVNVKEGIRLQSKLNESDALLKTMEHRLFDV